MKCPGDAGAEHEADQHKNRGQRQHCAPGDARHERSSHQHAAEHEQRELEVLRIGRQQQRHLHVRDGHPVRVAESRERSGVQITVLGKSPAWQDAGGACSGYLVQEDDYTLLLDCGNGVFSKLRHYRDYVDVSAVLVTHLHADHFLDLIPFSYALTYAPRQQPVPVAGWPGTDKPARPHLYAPPGAAEVFR
ncbi:MAG: MBL fold metallo-hydrolase, partial [Actinobacteria bacterium]